MTKQNVSILRERTMRQKPIPLAGMLFVAMSVAGCSGGSSSPAGAPPPVPTPSAATILSADAGGVCETLLKGVAYTSTPPALACNHGADPYTAYLDGSKSTASSGVLGY